MRDPEIRTLWPIAVVCGALLASSYVVLVDCEIDYPAQSTEMPYNFDCAAFDCESCVHDAFCHYACSL